MHSDYTIEKDLFADLDTLRPASKLQRFVNALIDTIIICVFAFMLLILCATLFDEAYDEIANDGSDSLLMLDIVYFIAHIIYYTVMEGGVKGYTFGKMITRTYVVKSGGAPASWANAFFRSLIRLIPFEAFSAFSELWHDKWTNTTVVKK
jgi:uncharacterized RDD family membrane protein YckC